MFPECPEHCSVEGKLSEYSRNTVRWLGCSCIFFDALEIKLDEDNNLMQ